MTNYLAAFDLLPAQIAVLDRQGNIVFTNRAWRETAEGRLPARNWNYLSECEAAADRGCREACLVGEDLSRLLRGELNEFVATYTSPFDRRHHWFQIAARRTRATDAEYGAVVMHINVTAVQLDHLTGIANRALFEAQARYVLTMAREKSAMAGIALIDLDGFKPINDQFGHAVGDNVLTQVAQRLSAATSEEQLIGRLGGDEFGVVTGLECNELALGHLQRDLDHVFTEPFLAQDMAWRLSASIGAAIYPADGETLELLMRTADSRMYDLKGSARATAKTGVRAQRVDDNLFYR